MGENQFFSFKSKISKPLKISYLKFEIVFDFPPKTKILLLKIIDE
jgi:hypothetical protein